MQKTNYILLFHDNNVIYRNNIFAINIYIYILSLLFVYKFYLRKLFFIFIFILKKCIFIFKN